MLYRVLNAVPAAMLLLAGSATAQTMEDVDIGVESIRDGVHMLTGRGGNIGLVVTEDGAFLIDDQYAPLTDKIIGAVESVTDQPVKFVLNTHWHGDHTGGNENLAERGTMIVAHDNVRERMSTEQAMEFFGRTVPASPNAALPAVTFNDEVTFYLGEHSVSAFHVPRAHTDGDSVVHLPEANIIHAGDTVFYGLYPFIDVDSGGSLPGMISAVERIAELADEETVIIPGHGPIIDREQLLRYHEMLTTVHERLGKAVEQGKSLEETQAMGITEEFDEQWGGGFIPPDRWIELLYRGATEAAPSTPEERVIDVIAKDFSIEAPAQLDTGWYTMRLQNQGQQTHFVIMYRLAEGKTIEDQRREVVPAFDAVMAGIRSGEIGKAGIGAFLGENIPEWGLQMTYVGGAGLVAPGKTTQSSFLIPEPGTYLMECYVKSPDGTWHTSMGMLTQVEVTEQDGEGAEPEADTTIAISNDGIEAPDTLPAGKQTIRVDIKDRPESFMPYDVNLAKLDDEATLDDIVFWMDWSNVGGLRAPAPVEFLGGVEHMETGNHGYMTVDLSPGRYLWISEINAGEMHKTFAVE